MPTHPVDMAHRSERAYTQAYLLLHRKAKVELKATILAMRHR